MLYWYVSKDILFSDNVVAPVTADSHQKKNPVTTGVTTQKDSLGFFWLNYRKMHKKNDNIKLYFQQKKCIQKLKFIYFWYTNLHFAPKVRHILPSWDVCLCLAPKYLHIDMLTKTYRMFKFSVSRYFTCSVLVKFSLLFGDHRLQCAWIGSRRFRAPCQRLR